MPDFTLFNKIRENASRADKEVSNVSALGLPADTKTLNILWMYPDVLEMHGARGDAMALLHFANLMKLPVVLRKVTNLTDDIPFAWADMMLFSSGDLDSMADLAKAMLPKKKEFEEFRDAGKVILVIGSTGAAFGEKITYLDGHTAEGLGLFQMEAAERERISGNDLWFETKVHMKVLGVEIQHADIKLHEGQKPFGKVIYGRGNNGHEWEGARTENAIFTHAVGPLMAKNPRLTEQLLVTAAKTAGLAGADSFKLEDSMIELEMAAQKDVETLVQKKIDGIVK